MGYGFAGVLGWALFWIVLIAAVVIFIKYKKMYPVFYLISIALYIFTMGFMIDVFEFGKLGILLTLAFSAVLFMVLGFYLSKVFHLEHHSK